LVFKKFAKFYKWNRQLERVKVQNNEMGMDEKICFGKEKKTKKFFGKNLRVMEREGKKEIE
jgi:hypothetical protein